MTNSNDNKEMSFSTETSMDDIFNMSTEEVITEKAEGTGGGGDPDFYFPSLKNEKVKNNTYDALIRFVPNVFAKEDNMPKEYHHKVHKFIYYLPDPTDPSRGFYVDCPSNGTGEKARKNIISAAHFDLKKNDSATLRNMAFNEFNRKEFYYSLVLILKDEYQPDLNGKIKIMKFGNPVNEKIETLAKGSEKYAKKAVNVYHPLVGRDFIMIIDKKKVDDKKGGQKEITSYDNSSFDSSDLALPIDGIITNNRYSGAKEDMEKIMAFLKTNSPKLSKVVYQEWTPEVEAKIIESVRNTIADPPVFDNIYKKVYGTKYTGANLEVKDDKKEATTQQTTAAEQPKNDKNPAAENDMSKIKDKVEAKDGKVDTATENTAANTNTTNESPAAETFGGDINFDDLP